MKKLSLLILLVTCFYLPYTKAACTDTLYLVNKKCYINNKKVTQAELSALFKPYPEAQKAYDNYITMLGRDIMLSSATGFAFGYGISPFLFPTTSNYNQTLHLVLIGIGLGGLVWSITQEEKKQQALSTAISSYNKALFSNCTNP